MDDRIKLLTENISKVITGKQETVINIITALLCRGHILIEDVPGVGKTRLIAALAASLDGEFNRIQLTPDIMPSDIVGYSIPDSQSGELIYHSGAAMCNFLLADEINRASSKSQSALLEIMEENQISLDKKTYLLPKPFMVLATQNPVETYGTYHLPEAQMDRFLMRVSMGYPTMEEEMQILTVSSYSPKELKSVMSAEDIIFLQNEADTVNVHPAVADYILRITNKTRYNPDFTLGISPRGSIALYRSSKALALIKGRNYVIPEDVKELCVPVLAHRLILSPKGRQSYGTGINAVKALTDSVEVPVG